MKSQKRENVPSSCRMTPVLNSAGSLPKDPAQVSNEELSVVIAMLDRAELRANGKAVLQGGMWG